MDRCIENAIEFLIDDKIATVTFSRGKYKTRIRKLAESHPEECEIIAENKDGSMCAHIPVAWIRINPYRAITEEGKKALAENARNNFGSDNYLDCLC